MAHLGATCPCKVNYHCLVLFGQHAHTRTHTWPTWVLRVPAKLITIALCSLDSTHTHTHTWPTWMLRVPAELSAIALCSLDRASSVRISVSIFCCIDSCTSMVALSLFRLSRFSRLLPPAALHLFKSRACVCEWQEGVRGKYSMQLVSRFQVSLAL